jgi:predicted enzyme related to lactoylglutathione lyase
MAIAERIESNVEQRQLTTFWWMDIAANGRAQAEQLQAFYGGLLGWTWGEWHQQFHYCIASRGGNRVAGLSDMLPEGAKTAWVNHVLVADAAATVSRARELGGAVLYDTMQIGDEGWMALLEDPTGAVFGLWQPGEHAGAELANAVGARAWTELRTADAERAREFYGELFGWTCDRLEMSGQDYWAFAAAGARHAGLHQLDPAVHTNLPYWCVTIGVEDVDQAAEYVAANGGTVTYGPMDTPFGRALGVVDPAGSHLNVMQLRGGR